MARTVSAILLAALLAACTAADFSPPVNVWNRIDGRSIKGDPALQRQFEADVAICEAAADSASQSAETQQAIITAQTTESPVPGAPGLLTNNPARSSVLGSVAASDASDVAMKGCMAQRGYLLSH